MNQDRLNTAIERIKSFEPKEGYYLAFSGGKDSIVCYQLLKRAGVKFESHYNLTTVDPPELVRFIKREYPDVFIEHPELSMWQLIRKKGFPPHRFVRYCCAILKEGGGENRFVVTGVRWAESKQRESSRHEVEFDSYGSQSKKAKAKRELFLNSDNDERRMMIETCIIKGKNILNPIIDWRDSDVWMFIRENNFKYPALYDNGFKRLGCILCPLASVKNRKREARLYPKYVKAYIRVFDDIIEKGHEKGQYLKYPDGKTAFKEWLELGQITINTPPNRKLEEF